MSLPFQGEMMHCALCEARQKSDPNVSSNWRIIQMDGTPYYVCTKHFPADDAGAEAWKGVYEGIFEKLLLLHQESQKT